MIVPTAKYEGGQPKRAQLQTEAIDQSQTIREKVLPKVIIMYQLSTNACCQVAKISGDPNESQIPSTHLQPEIFRKQVLVSLQKGLIIFTIPGI